MKTRLATLILILISTASFAQITFEKGYLIDNNGQRIECLIKNMDWNSNPAEFEYKKSENEQVYTGNLDNTKEFGITGYSRYVNADVKIDGSSWEMANLSKQRNPEWIQKRLFLKVLVEGKATLYLYKGNNMVRFLYSVGDSSINQLICKEYFVDENHVGKNRKFREQLWIDMRCENTKMSSVAKMNFKKTELENYFKKYNECNAGASIVYGEKEKNKSFHLRVTPGVTISNVSVTDDFYIIYNTEFKNKPAFRIGTECEYVLPFNKNKWGILFEPTFQHLNNEQYIGEVTANINYNSIELAAGLRHYFFLNNNLTLFADALFVPGYSLDFNSTITYDYPFASPLNIKTKYSIAFGGGLGYKKLSAEVRYCTERDMLDNFYWEAKYSSFSVILGFKLF
jgi:hypothetical protein